ncbi:hypothetical protein E5161_12720 [Cohnella pontilimi]|uniref:Uncharacterized protein n=1 Tax=Cohnella pontilimi TaxID=2564100 RepID=A0A4V5LS06_9BACL|nr:hypothetical protein [Cohnella pontilimi]TJY41289.1 hypothetical protein E5161_12720 [Cohnella pontilimi]
MTVVGIILAAGAMFWMDGLPLARRCLWKDFWIFLTLLLFGVGLLLIHALKIEIASPVYAISVIFKPVNQFIRGLFS